MEILFVSGIKRPKGLKRGQENKKKGEEMRKIKLAKLVINCCVGESGDKLTKAAKVLVNK